MKKLCFKGFCSSPSISLDDHLKSAFQVTYGEALILDLHKTAMSIFGLMELKDSSLIHSVSMQAKIGVTY